jgi:hypothetical protein
MKMAAKCKRSPNECIKITQDVGRFEEKFPSYAWEGPKAAPDKTKSNTQEPPMPG